MVNNSLIRPYFLGGGIGGVPLDSHDKNPKPKQGGEGFGAANFQVAISTNLRFWDT